MANITTNKNAVELRKEQLRNGTVVEYIVIDGVKCGIMGSVNDEDRANALKTIQDAYAASNGSVMEMIGKLATIATIEEKGIDPDEVVNICGTDVILSYNDAKAYTMSGEEIANCEDLGDMPTRAIKAVLMARVEAILN